MAAVVAYHKQSPEERALHQPEQGIKPPGIQAIGRDVEGYNQTDIPQKIGYRSPDRGLKTLFWNGVFQILKGKRQA
jgi:hypothetical protein